MIVLVIAIVLVIDRQTRAPIAIGRAPWLLDLASAPAVAATIAIATIHRLAAPVAAEAAVAVHVVAAVAAVNENEQQMRLTSVMISSDGCGPSWLVHVSEEDGAAGAGAGAAAHAEAAARDLNTLSWPLPLLRLHPLTALLMAVMRIRRLATT